MRFLGLLAPSEHGWRSDTGEILDKLGMTIGFSHMTVEELHKRWIER